MTRARNTTTLRCETGLVTHHSKERVDMSEFVEVHHDTVDVDGVSPD
jgi:hypothetical protein